MSGRDLLWIALAAVFTATFLLALLRIALEDSSVISFSRLLEDRGTAKKAQARLLRLYEPVFVASGFWRNILLIGFLVLLSLLFPGGGLRPLRLFLVAAAVYVVVLDGVPRLVTALSRGRVVVLLLPLFPLIHLLSSPFFFLLGRLGAEKKTVREATDPEIEAFIQEAHEEGIIEPGEGRLLRSAVEFGDTIVREIMIPRREIVGIGEEATIEAVRLLAIGEKYSRIPVYKDRLDNIEGIIHVKDLLAFSEDEHKSQPIKPLIRPVHFVPEAMKIDELLKDLQKRKENMAIVVDEYGGVSGLVTLEDLLEELVGEIQDEYDQEEALIHQNSPDDIVVSGEVRVEEVEDLFGGLDIAGDDYITMSGFITHQLARLPRPGERLTVRGLEIEALEVDQKRVTKIRLRRKPLPPDEGKS
ncbi:MAG: HlyC/CorC family transporter [Candidatus Aminicenantes bacterium]|nr:HlyC/CorC family transporter [Candidatus Aminicenantes bacterium]